LTDWKERKGRRGEGGKEGRKEGDGRREGRQEGRRTLLAKERAYLKTKRENYGFFSLFIQVPVFKSTDSRAIRKFFHFSFK
jgi:hypothetical protein